MSILFKLHNLSIERNDIVKYSGQLHFLYFLQPDLEFFCCPLEKRRLDKYVKI